jgi:NAD(P)-dependent dehydrogenase (short-subunit alcohol dehydrogenase family)
MTLGANGGGETGLGKTYVVTGASSGIGFETARALARQGAKVLAVSRGSGRGAAQAEAIRRESGNPDVRFVAADLSSLSEVRRAAGVILSETNRLDALVNNAGVYLAKRETTADGLEATFAINHLAPFLLTHLLLPRLRSSVAPGVTPRVVTVASDAARLGRLHQDVMLARGYGGWKAYAQSKLANLLFTFALARRLSGTGVVANALHPGTVATGFAQANGGGVALFFRVFAPLMRSPAAGARGAIFLASAPEAALVSGGYFRDDAPLAPPPHALDEALQERLWRQSAELTGVGSGMMEAA